MIEPQNLNIATLPYLSLEQRKALPKFGGIYFAINANEEILYIGRSIDINARWQQHHRYKQLKQIEGIKIAWLELSDELLLPEIELALIEWFSPPLNNSLTEPSRLAKGLRIAFYVDLSEHWTDDKNLSIQKAHEKTGLDKRTLSAAKKGILDRAHIDTLVKLKNLASELTGKSLALEDIIKEKS